MQNKALDIEHIELGTVGGSLNTTVIIPCIDKLIEEAGNGGTFTVYVNAFGIRQKLKNYFISGNDIVIDLSEIIDGDKILHPISFPIWIRYATDKMTVRSDAYHARIRPAPKHKPQN